MKGLMSGPSNIGHKSNRKRLKLRKRRVAFFIKCVCSNGKIIGNYMAIPKSSWANIQNAPPSMLIYTKTIINRFLKNRNKFESWEIGRKNDELYKAHQRSQGFNPGRISETDERFGCIDWTIRKTISKVECTFA